MTPKISIIIPVYNAEKCLSQCLDSVLVQTFTDWECLLVDDGSNDESIRICDEYAAKDSRFRVFHKKNGGVSSARNMGLEQVDTKSIFITFIDADDILPPNALCSLLSGLDEYHSSSMGGFSWIDESNNEMFRLDSSNSDSLSVADVINMFYDTNSVDWHRYLWNRVLRTDIIAYNRLRFREDIYYKEDGLFLIEYLCSDPRNIYNSKDIVYNYRKCSNSATSNIETTFNPKVMTSMLAHSLIITKLKSSKTILSTKYKIIINTACREMYYSYLWLNTILQNASQEQYVMYKKEIKTTLISTIGYTRFYAYSIRRFASESIHKILNV